MQKLEPVDLATLSPADFHDEELDLPYYLAHFHRLANALIEDGPDRGFIDIPVWRREKDNRPYNARIMENILSFAYFYCTDRPWNAHHGHPALRTRLEAALDFWCRIQADDGRFSEYGPEKWNLASTAFATKFMGQTLQLLDDGPGIDAGLLSRVVEADRGALGAVFRDEQFQEHGRSFTNQYANAWSGALAFLDLHRDDDLERVLRARIETSMTAFQSRAGYFYEKDGPDWGYYLGTHSSDLHGAWHYTKGTDLGDRFIEKSRRFYDWFAHNIVMEPDASGFAVNRSIETRQQRRFLEVHRFIAAPYARSRVEHLEDCPLGERVETARAFSRTDEEWAEDHAEARRDVEERWPKVSELAVGEFWAFSPYAFLHRSHGQWSPSQKQREEARKRLPYIARNRFTHVRVDGRHPTIFSFVRRPAYYATFSTGRITSEQQRFGLGLLWHPTAGALLQSQTGSVEDAWGTRLHDRSGVVESESFDAICTVDGSSVEMTPGVRDLNEGDYTVRYDLPDGGEKTVTFAENEIRVHVAHAGDIAERIPLLVGGEDRLEESGQGAALTRGEVTLDIAAPTAVSSISESGAVSGRRSVKTVVLAGKGTLSYRLRLASGSSRG